MSDVENGNVAELGANSKHGSLSTLNMEWDNQGLRLFKLLDLFCREIYHFYFRLFQRRGFQREDFPGTK